MGGQEVIVKVQYPEVAELHDADFSNLEKTISVTLRALELCSRLRDPIFSSGTSTC